MGVSCIVDFIVGKMGLVSEQNVTNHMGVRINPTARFQLATRPQVQDAECTGYGTDMFLLRAMFARL